ncbi:hypothetical protein AW736_15105 [Termitidicoccus mucosus]|uniref:O-antigen ligase-related domain-containing protein n=1 Tax=Termitidicoccus mucosus TaxID=1184151 RepID=A0A178IG77_9BACT|nr:hypothetical protein AW736_15105 [Opitutaceae bacterium TSB47]
MVFVLILVWVIAGFVTAKKKEHRALGYAHPFLLLLELTVWFLLAKTCSRGGFMAAAGAALFFFVVRLGPVRLSACLKAIAPRVAVAALLLVLVGAVGRFSPGHLATDKSVSNRLEMWRGALAMVHDSPFNGWGFRNGGLAYANWYQSLDAAERPVGFVNSYLDVAVEYGLHLLAVAVLLLAFLVILSVTREHSLLMAAAGACLVAWGLANVWSSLWMEPLLWIFPLFAMFLIVVGAARSQVRAVLGALFRAALVSCAATAALWCAGRHASRRYEWLVIKDSATDKVTLCKRGHPGGADNPRAQVEIWADGAVFGPFYGRAIRAAAPLFSVRSAIIYPPWHVTGREEKPSGNPRIYAGFHATRIFDTPHDDGNIVLLHPTAPPRRGDGAKIDCPRLLLCLPEQDSSEHSLPWRRWATTMNIKPVYSPQLGQRIIVRENIVFWRRLFACSNNASF